MKILIRLPNWLGDVVMGSAFVAAVRECYPQSRIDVIVKQELKPIVTLLPGITNIYGFSRHEFRGLTGAFIFGKQLRPNQYDLFFCLPTSLSSRIMGWATGAKARVGFAKQSAFFLLTHSYSTPANRHRVEEYLSLLAQFTGRPMAHIPVALKLHSTIEPTNRVLINFNSEAASRRMPLAKGIHIINTLLQAFQTRTFTLVGSPKDAPFVNELIQGCHTPERLENYASKTDLQALCELIASSRVVLTTDSGPAHVANSLDTPTVVLFGAGNERNTAPYNPKDLNVIRYGGLPCESCVNNTCRLYGVPKCMELLDETRIVAALKQYL